MTFKKGDRVVVKVPSGTESTGVVTGIGPVLDSHVGAGYAGSKEVVTVKDDRTGSEAGFYYPWYDRTIEVETAAEDDTIEHPAHYTAHPSGVECIQITEHYGFLRGNAIKYLWRAGAKANELEDLKKARWYIDREIANLEEFG